MNYYYEIQSETQKLENEKYHIQEIFKEQIDDLDSNMSRVY
jgi:hypothetical protein